MFIANRLQDKWGFPPSAAGPAMSWSTLNVSPGSRAQAVSGSEGFYHEWVSSMGRLRTVLVAQAKPLAAEADESCGETLPRPGFDARRGMCWQWQDSGRSSRAPVPLLLGTAQPEQPGAGGRRLMARQPWVLDPFCPLILPNLCANEI